MIKTIFGLVFILSIGVLSGCTKVDNEGENTQSKAGSVETVQYKDITPKDAKALLSDDNSAILLDVRTVEEYTEKHIPGSILIPVDVINKEASEKLKDKDATIIVYCRSGRRSVTAAKALIKLGYTNVYNLGGIIDWPYETETGAPNTNLRLKSQ